MRRFALVLHTHVPYVRRNGVWPCGEDFFHQAAVESYLPLLSVLERLSEAGGRSLCSIGVTPVLAHQMHDPHMRRELLWYLGRYELRAMEQVANFEGHHARETKDMAAFYARFARIQMRRLEADARGIAAGFAALEDAGAIELLGGPATHPLLPRISSTALRDLQMRAGIAEHERVIGRRPKGMWIPECATAPGIEETLEKHGIAYGVVDPGSAGGVQPVRPGRSFVAIPFDRNVTQRIWNAQGGYPIGAWYRDFYHYDMGAGFKNWRVTDHTLGVLSKEPYEPAAAAAQARSDADDFVATLERAFESHDRDTIVVALDTELLGHWWFEGPQWLAHVLERLVSHPTIRPCTLEEVAAGATAGPPLTEGTWGDGGDFRSWDDSETASMLSRLAHAEQVAEQVAGPVARAGGDGSSAFARSQILRELLLAQASDWPYMIVRGANAEYARRRFAEHLDRLDAIAGPLARGDEAAADAAASAAFEIDNCFAALPFDGRS